MRSEFKERLATWAPGAIVVERCAGKPGSMGAVSVKRMLVLVVSAVVLVGVLGASSAVSAPARISAAKHVATRSMTVEVRLIQEVTYHGADHWLSTTLHLFAIGETFGLPTDTYLGSMSFAYQLHGTCETSAPGCSGTANLKTVTNFPGGTISAGGPQIHLVTSPG
jgi:hypothetical protein